MKEETAVKWLIEKLESHIMWTDKARAAFEQAKEMEKEQHKKTWSEGMFCETGDIQAFEQYYNETFKTAN